LQFSNKINWLFCSSRCRFL